MGFSVRLLVHSGSPRAFSPRDDKVWGRYAVSGIVTTRSLSLRGGSGARDAAIHRVSRNADGFVSSLTGSQWIATGFALAMTGCGGMVVCGSVISRSLSLRGGSGAREVAIHRVFESRARVCLFAYWFTLDRHGLSALAMTRCGNQW